jgi:hypothetical protein
MIRRVISGLLTLAVLIGTVGVSYDSHFCGGELIKSQLSIIPHSLSCGMKMQACIDDDNKNTSSISTICCSNDHMSIELCDDYVEYHAQQLTFINDFSYPDLITHFSPTSLTVEYEFLGYTPPPAYDDVIILHQTFLI